MTLIFNPVEFVSQIITVAVVLVVVAFMIKHRDRVLIALTGDDRIHVTPMDCIYFSFCRCCGVCNGDWTRPLTRLCCCPVRWRNVNLVRELSKFLGITAYTVELKNLVVGDLPFNSRGDFYLQVECSSNPPMTTALAEEKLPKVIHFPEILTLRLRWSLWEPSVKISVRELNIFGSQELCYCYIGAMHLLDWAASPQDAMKRFNMRPSADNEVDRETPAWVLLEVALPADDRDLDSFHGGPDTVRTATGQGHYDDWHLSQFKHEYALLDASGHAMQEPLEEDLAGIEYCEQFFRRVERTLLCIGLFALTVPTVATLWAGDCYRRYRWLTIARLQYPKNEVFSMGVMQNLAQQCHTLLDGTGAAEGSSPCRPGIENIFETCLGPNTTGFPAKQPAVTAFPAMTSKLSAGLLEIPCPAEACHLFRSHETNGLFLTGACWIAFILILLCVRLTGYKIVATQKASLQRQAMAAAKETKNLTRQTRGYA
mmetsp:Transcript_41630/g.89368  ORF Transcript_41630/g.89368 Transcript_41630/m.89368 type:complete len:484 (-) Transcript_41630:369-1820(-)|eukprot:CAMPEP_0206468932 /NCGR_PEP_ID=MMETSP0324_2-20121206/29949_1 /ASSEMBLY_ACC=CAM_ASM_000836 /TAXON_ID=2866 /ORGANISM="Crypthecodinium cohnii, Strain Seligo" /LENGTH=483 /DNA_ID=CAMNT_0053942535 /DNA_START=109 /DNA_END=1560 /DNA_ORIENTATION=+